MKRLIFIIIVFIGCSGYEGNNPLNANRISFQLSRWYQMTHADAGIGELFDGKTTSTVGVGKKSIVSNYEIYYSFAEGETVSVDQIRMYDGQWSNTSPFEIYIIDKNYFY